MTRTEHILFFLPVLNQLQVFNSEIIITLIKLVLIQKLVFDFEIIITLIELVLIQTPK
jgi:hypothetical protein